MDTTFFSATVADKSTGEDAFITVQSQHGRNFCIVSSQILYYNILLGGSAQLLEPVLTNVEGTSKGEASSLNVLDILTSHTVYYWYPSHQIHICQVQDRTPQSEKI
jgi:hypothetical protein